MARPFGAECRNKESDQNYYGIFSLNFFLANIYGHAIFIMRGREAEQTGGNMIKVHSCVNGEMIEGDTYWKKDGYGIPLTLVCSKCVKEKMSQYRSDIEERYDTDECIDGDDW